MAYFNNHVFRILIRSSFKVGRSLVCTPTFFILTKSLYGTDDDVITIGNLIEIRWSVKVGNMKLDGLLNGTSKLFPVNRFLVTVRGALVMTHYL